MRPKKVVLILGGDEQRISECRLLLSVKGFRPVADTSIFTPDAVIGFWPCGSEVVNAAARFSVQAMVIGPAKKAAECCALRAYATLTHSVEPWEIVERTLTMTARKRGPKKGVKYETTRTSGTGIPNAVSAGGCA